MHSDHVLLRSRTIFGLLDPAEAAVPVQVELRYDTRDPYAVTAAFRTSAAGWVEWCYSREMLADGLLSEVGSGDIRIRPDDTNPELVIIVLSSPSGQAVFEAPASVVVEFLDRTYDIVVPGSEHQWVSVDDALGQLMPNDQV